MNRLLRQAGGFTLVELMISLLLGTMVMVAAIGIFSSNRQTFTTTEGVGRMQENMRFAFELMAKDLREAGGNPCGHHVPLSNVINASNTRWWTNLNSSEDADGELTNPWWNTLQGVAPLSADEGTTAGSRLAGTEAIQLLSADANVVTVTSHNGTTFVLNTAAHGFQSGNLVLVCSSRQASAFQAIVAGTSVTHPASGTPGNCVGNLGLPAGCGAQAFAYPANSMMSRLNASRWFVGVNGRGSSSLYLSRTNANGQGMTNQEMVDGVTGLSFQYLRAGDSDYVDQADVAGRWGDVVAVRVTVTVNAENSRGTGGAPLSRTLVHTVSLRSRNA